ncbi:hypothetical protein HK099_008361 [Clydaea vesicula]|uniref:ATP-grasp domain-containing protein n=1 Tax=Clydaea vesicula TaxID=447962 RepID=A0AAD5TXZ7_9FUNG|nr:hypothetical protein HK099_008361 [Clydaea vesicula]
MSKEKKKRSLPFNKQQSDVSLYKNKNSSDLFSSSKNVGGHRASMPTSLLQSLVSPSQTDLVVIPSLSLDSQILSKVNGLSYYDERLLFNILCLRYNSNRVFYFTSTPLHLDLIDYYCNLINTAHNNLSQFKNRFFNISVNDSSSATCLSNKILFRPQILKSLKNQLNPNKNLSLEVFRGTFYEEKIAKTLQLKLNSCKGRDVIWGTKANSRTIFRHLSIPHPDGTYEAEFDLNRLFERILCILEKNSTSTRGVIKLDESFAGKGNVIIELKETQKVLNSSKKNNQTRRLALKQLKLAYKNSIKDCDGFTDNVKRLGAIFELFNETKHSNNSGKFQTSPSVQVLIRDGKVEVLSTHEQILNGHTYIGCSFPCLQIYREVLETAGEKVGKFLMEKGISDYFSVDFMCDPPLNDNEGWDIKALEINLRMTGTTNPFLLSAHLIQHSLEINNFNTVSNTDFDLKNLIKENFCYISVEQNYNENFKHLTIKDLTEIFKVNSRFGWNPETKKGCILFKFGGISELGCFGLTCISSNIEDCKEIFTLALKFVEFEAIRIKNIFFNQGLSLEKEIFYN